MSAAPEASTSVIKSIVPRATFVEDVPTFVKDSGKEIDELLGEVQSTLQRYRHVEQQLQEKKLRLASKKPEIEKCLDAVTLLIDSRESEEDVEVDFSLADQVYARAKLQKDAGYVGLWLGAGVMVEYGLEEAKALLEEQLASCDAQLEELEDDYAYVADQTTTTQVTLARVYNHSVELNRRNVT
jgi:prefoldin subunit 5